jgi:hypothetical protein
MKGVVTEEKRWIYQSKNGIDVECWVCRIGSDGSDYWRTGYAKKPVGLPEDFDSLVIRVHGGVTYDHAGVIGFDAHHPGDTPDKWTLKATVNETEEMAEDLSTHVSQLIHITRMLEES